MGGISGGQHDASTASRTAILRAGGGRDGMAGALTFHPWAPFGVVPCMCETPLLSLAAGRLADRVQPLPGYQPEF